jgi:hypothetical protein
MFNDVVDEMDKQFIVSECVSSGTPLNIVLDAMTIPQRFQVEQAMNAILAKMSDDELKVFKETCNTLKNEPKIMWSFHIATEDYYDKLYYSNLKSMTKGLYEWLTFHKISIVRDGTSIKFVFTEEKLQTLSPQDFIKYWEKHYLEPWDEYNYDAFVYGLSLDRKSQIRIEMYHVDDNPTILDILHNRK